MIRVPEAKEANRGIHSRAKLAAMETTDDGYELAAYDLSLRREAISWATASTAPPRSSW